jgi:hypothetical protein
MVAKNDVTGDAIQTKGVSNAYRDNYDLAFGKKKKTDAEQFDEAIMKNEYYEDHTDGYKGKQPEGTQSEHNVDKDR